MSRNVPPSAALDDGRAPASEGIAPDDLATLPKVELHVHLEGSVPAATAVELARSHGDDPAEVLPFVPGPDGALGYPPRYAEFMEFVRTYLAVTAQVRRPEDLFAVARDVARRQAQQRVRWSEFTFTAATLVNQGWDADAMWEAVRDGLAEVPEAPAGLIIDAVRDNGPASALQTLELAERGLELGVPIVGIGLAGSETSRPEDDFTELRPGATSLGLGLAVHAGETGTAENVRRALDLLHADRIGHGVQAVHDPQLLARLRDEQVVLEVCPTSNVVLGVVPSHDEHPLPRLVEAGVAVTINSDDPPFFSTSLTEELAHAVRLLDLGREDLADLQRRAARASFAPDGHRARILDEVDRWASRALLAGEPGLGAESD